ncbi:hypothetical protein R3P38DRAFT_3409554 [Favolaschia claudopus]|uniref:F-box domain-containing protein n=1 Tax=Favolaschia claudopus TaxID=2862362 RepID=A0AAV9ZNK6_9AGAR
MSTTTRIETAFTSTLLPTPGHTAYINRFTRSGTVPPKPTAVKTVISAATSHLARYDAQIVLAQRELDRLVSERNTLAGYVDSCRSAIAPIQKLPTELLVEIFDLCFPEDKYHPSWPTAKDELYRVSHRDLLQLAQVSCYWFRVVTETPKLWATIVVDTSLWGHESTPYRLMAKFLWSALVRGGNHPLDIDIGLAATRSDKPVLGMLETQRHRWKSVFIFTDPWAKVPQSLASWNTENLEALFLDLRWKAAQTIEAPRLKSLTFAGKLDNQPSLPWSQLEKCTYRRHSVDYCKESPLSVLRLATNAEISLEFDLGVCFGNAVAVTETLTSDIPALHLELANAGDSAAVARLFDCLTLSGLRSFEYEPQADTLPPVWSTEHFLMLSDRSGFSARLMHLKIEALGVSDVELLRCLKALPQLEDLFVLETHPTHKLVTDVLLEGLRCSPGIAPIIPRLAVLRLHSRLEFSDGLYADLVASRVENCVLGDVELLSMSWEKKKKDHMVSGKNKRTKEKKNHSRIRPFHPEESSFHMTVRHVRIGWMIHAQSDRWPQESVERR